MAARLLTLLRLFIVLALTAGFGCAVARETPAPLASAQLATLPAEARHTLELIKRGRPFPYKRDGITFGNYEKRLPYRPRGHYREYTVPTPGSRDRGARRIIAGSPPETSGEYYYTDDHYRSFRRIRE